MFGGIATLKHEMSEYAWVRWFMGCEWWVWHDLDNKHVWDDWL